MGVFDSGMRGGLADRRGDRCAGSIVLPGLSCRELFCDVGIDDWLEKAVAELLRLAMYVCEFDFTIGVGTKRPLIIPRREGSSDVSC